MIPEVMQAASDVRKIMAGAEQAEARGDHAGAERLLRQALGLQEATLGPQHPEVANTLNNLAIVSEMNGKLAEAEACYRRAYAIATANLPPGDPFVTTSRDNLEQFCTARGIPLTLTPSPATSSPASSASSSAQSALASFAPSAPTASSAPPAQAASPAPPPRPAPPPAPKPAAPAPRAAAPPPPRPAASHSLGDMPLHSSSAAPVSPRTPTPIAVAATGEPSRAIAVAAILALLAVLLVGGWYLMQSNPTPAKNAATTTASPSATPPAASSSAPSTPAAEPVTEPAPVVTDTTPAATPPAKPEPVEPPAAAAPTPPAPAARERPAATSRTSSLDVVSAELCRNLTTGSAWKCAPATDTVAPGMIYFYTRVASGGDTTIEHRWYRDDRLLQSVPLRIRANPSGYRTYSRTAITPDRVGKWKVELRAQNGEVLDEKTFVVQP